MALSHVRLPNDPEERRVHLLGLDSALRGLDEEDVEARRPTLEPWRTIFDGGRNVGLAMKERNPGRREALQRGEGGRRHRIRVIAEEKEARRPPPLP